MIFGTIRESHTLGVLFWGPYMRDPVILLQIMDAPGSSHLSCYHGEGLYS